MARDKTKRDDVLRRMLKTPPKPHKPKEDKAGLDGRARLIKKGDPKAGKIAKLLKD